MQMEMECFRNIATAQTEEIEGKSPKGAAKAEAVEWIECLITVDACYTFFVERCLYLFSVS